ncbi:hypothetical protein DP092_23545 [Pseudomonas sp. MDMC224]|nr:hypothetical protein DP092_23545 [Pseudomonas sp. MDMC224]
MGHPWPIAPRLASMPNAPLHSTSTRPPDGIRGSRCLNVFGRQSKGKARASRLAPRCSRFV